MKYLRKRLKPDLPQQSAANEAARVPVGARVRTVKETEGEYSDDSPFSWFGIGQADSSVFDAGSLIIDKSQDRDTVSYKTLDLEGDSLRSTGEDMGVDPYNTGRFDTAK